MIKIRRSNDRGRTRLDWLDSRHTFSFGDYYDPQHMGFSDLRVINEDRVQPGKGFGTHSHRDMEILTYVLEGALAHKDSTGTSSVIRVGEVQRMSAGTGISHSEYNASQGAPVHFLQIWIVPSETGLKPGYEQNSVDFSAKPSGWILAAAPEGRGGAIKVHQDAELSIALIRKDEQVTYSLNAGRNAWIQVARGTVTLNGLSLGAGDGAAISDERLLTLAGMEDSECMLFDLS